MSRVYRRGQTVRVGAISLRQANNELEHSRAAVVVSKKVAKSAPVRNRIRRRLFELLRLRWDTIAPGHDFIISVFADDLKSLPAKELERQFNQLLQKANLKA